MGEDPVPRFRQDV